VKDKQEGIGFQQSPTLSICCINDIKSFGKKIPRLCKAAKLNIKKLIFGDFIKIARGWLEENET
jgi:hypothetical protein